MGGQNGFRRDGVKVLLTACWCLPVLEEDITRPGQGSLVGVQRKVLGLPPVTSTFRFMINRDVVGAGGHLRVKGGTALLGRLARLVVVGRVGETREEGEAGHVGAVRVLGREGLVDLNFRHVNFSGSR